MNLKKIPQTALVRRILCENFVNYCLGSVTVKQTVPSS